MPWDKKTVDGKICVYKTTTGEVMHCYDNDDEADDYLAALHMHANEKQLTEWLDWLGKPAATSVYKQADGRYKIVIVATAALKDREGETYSTDAIDYDIEQAKRTGKYPVITMFHKSALEIGKITKMRRVGKFAVDDGVSHDDAFSLHVCKDLLSNNNGKWGASRGFYALETSGYCPKCDEGLILTTKHMLAGYRCPECGSGYIDYKGVLKDVHFRRTQTFEDTITDIPCVPYTGVTAYKDFEDLEAIVDKKQLKQRLLDAGLDEKLIDERLAKVTEKQLIEFDDIPMAKLLKEIKLEVADKADADGEVTLEQMREAWKEDIKNGLVVVKEYVQEAFDNLEIEISEPAEKEDRVAKLEEQVTELTATVKELVEVIEQLADKDEARLKEMLKDTPRNAKFRVARFKAGKFKADDEDEEDEEDDEEEETVPVKKGKKVLTKEMIEQGVVYGNDGQVYETLSDMLIG
jgi:hypothetical protein